MKNTIKLILFGLLINSLFTKGFAQIAEGVPLSNDNYLERRCTEGDEDCDLSTDEKLTDYQREILPFDERDILKIDEEQIDQNNSSIKVEEQSKELLWDIRDKD